MLSIATGIRAMRRRVVLAVIVTTAAACATNPPAGAGPADRNVITAEQIAALHVDNAYQVVERVRPSALHPRGNTSLDPASAPEPDVQVYIGDQLLGAVSSLRDIPVTDIQEIRFYDPGQAQYTFGSGHTAGVIQVIRKS